LPIEAIVFPVASVNMVMTQRSSDFIKALVFAYFALSRRQVRAFTPLSSSKTELGTPKLTTAVSTLLSTNLDCNIWRTTSGCPTVPAHPARTSGNINSICLNTNAYPLFCHPRLENSNTSICKEANAANPQKRRYPFPGQYQNAAACFCRYAPRGRAGLRGITGGLRGRLRGRLRGQFTLLRITGDYGGGLRGQFTLLRKIKR